MARLGAPDVTAAEQPHGAATVGEAATGTSDQPEPADAGAVAVGAGAGETGRDRNLVRLGLALTLLPLLVAAVHQLFWVGGDYYPSGDVAWTELHVRDVGRRMLWLGPFSREGWYHPGPALYYVLALPYRLLGSSGSALSVAGLLVNGTSIAGMVWLAKRRGGIEMALATLLVCALLLRALGWSFLDLPWNVYVTVLPYGLLLFLVWAMARGERWALPAATFVTTFVVQTHVGYVLLAIPLLLAAAAWLIASTVWQARTERSADDAAHPGDPGGEGRQTAGGPDGERDALDRPTGWRGWLRSLGLPGSLAPLWGPGLCTVAVGGLMWLPPLVQQFREEHGNVGLTVDWFRRHGEDTRTLLEGWRVVASQYMLEPEWLTGLRPVSFLGESHYVYERVVPVLLVVVLAAAVVWVRRRDPAAVPLVAVWAGASLLGIVGVARTVELLYAYRLRWTWVLAMVGGLLVVWLALRLLHERATPRQWQAVGTTVVVVLAGLAAVNAVTAVRSDTPTPESKLLADLAPAFRDELRDLPDRPGEVVVDPQSFGAIGVGQGLVLDLDRHGIPASLGNERRDDDRVRVRVAVEVDSQLVDVEDRPDHELLVYAGLLSLDELRRNVATRDGLLEDLQAGTITVRDYQRRDRALIPPYGAAAVFLVDR